MTHHASLHDTTAVRLSGSAGKASIADTLKQREQVLLQTQTSADAVLRPTNCGAWSPALRAALAARIACLHQLPELAPEYLGEFSADNVATLADTDNDGSTLGLAHVIVFLDTVATQPREATASDITRLKAHNVSDADIVRLTSLVAFMAYQLRLICGLRLLADMKT